MFHSIRARLDEAFNLSTYDNTLTLTFTIYRPIVIRKKIA